MTRLHVGQIRRGASETRVSGLALRRLAGIARRNSMNRKCNEISLASGTGEPTSGAESRVKEGYKAQCRRLRCAYGEKT